MRVENAQTRKRMGRLVTNVFNEFDSNQQYDLAHKLIMYVYVL